MPVKVTLRILPNCIKALRKEFPEIDNYITCSDVGKFEHISVPVSKHLSTEISLKMKTVSRHLSTTKAESVVYERYIYDKQYIIITKFIDSTVITLSGGYSV